MAFDFDAAVAKLREASPAGEMSADKLRVLAGEVARLVTGEAGPFDGPQVVSYALLSAKGAIADARHSMLTARAERDDARAKLAALSLAVGDEASLLRDWAEVIVRDGEAATSLALIAIADRLDDAAKSDAPASPRVELPEGDGTWPREDGIIPDRSVYDDKNDARAHAAGWPVQPNGVRAGPSLEDVAPIATSSPPTPDPRPSAPDGLEARVSAAIKQERDLSTPAPQTPDSPGWAEVWLDDGWRDVWVDEGEPDETGGVGLCWLNSKTGESDGVDGHRWRGSEPQEVCESLK